MIKIITGYSNPGGSTVTLKNLCKEFNARGYDCEMYGPHAWHLKFGDKHKEISQFTVKSEDKVIAHYIDLPESIKEQTVFSCHEMWWFDFTKVKKFYKKVQFLTQKQADYHSTIKDYVIIPNVKEVIKVDKVDGCEKVAGVIGAIEPRKDTVHSIRRALQDGCDKVYLYGPIMDDSYYTTSIVPLLGSGVVYKGYADKSEIYSNVGKVYHSSNGEVASLVKDECATTGTEFHGNEVTDNEISTLSNDEVIELWRKELEC